MEWKPPKYTHLNSTISTPGTRYACVDIRNSCTNSRLKEPECVKFPIRCITKEIIDEYNVKQYVDENSFVNCEIVSAMYGLKQAGKDCSWRLIKYLKPFGYYPSKKKKTGLFFHETQPISSTLVPDDLGVKFTRIEDTGHLFYTIEQKCPIKIDWSWSKNTGIDIDWHYNEKYVILLMKC